MNRSINEAFEKGIKDDATPEYVIKQVCTDHKYSLNIKYVVIVCQTSWYRYPKTENRARRRGSKPNPPK